MLWEEFVGLRLGGLGLTLRIVLILRVNFFSSEPPFPFSSESLPSEGLLLRLGESNFSVCLRRTTITLCESVSFLLNRLPIEES